jgi:hypothetical protein
MLCSVALHLYLHPRPTTARWPAIPTILSMPSRRTSPPRIGFIGEPAGVFCLLQDIWRVDLYLLYQFHPRLTYSPPISSTDFCPHRYPGRSSTVSLALPCDLFLTCPGLSMAHPCPRIPGRSVKQCCTRGFRDTSQVRALSIHAFMPPTAILPPITANSLKPLHPPPQAL